MKKTIFLLAIALSLSASAFAQSDTSDYLTITTYYPSPYGVYGTLKLHPRETPPGQCRQGEMYYHISDPKGVHVCDENHQWQPIGGGGGGGYWMEDPATHAINNTNPGKVIIDGVPGANGELFEIHGDTVITSNPGSGEGSLLYLVRDDGTTVSGLIFVSLLGPSTGLNDYFIATREQSPVKLSIGRTSVSPPDQYYMTFVDDRVGIGTETPSERLEVNGNVKASAFFYSSDASLKRNIRDLPHSLDRVLQIKGQAFEWKSDGRSDVGLIAQDVEKVFPELVATDKNTGLKSVEYGNLVAVLVEAVKEQQKQIDILQRKIEQLEAKRK